MKPRSIGIIAGGGGPIGSLSVLRDIIAVCQRQYGSWHSYEYPCINFYSYPYSEMLLIHNNNSSIPSRELSYCIQQLKLIGMEIIVVPCFTLSSYLTYRNYGIELIEMGTMLFHYLEKNNIKNPLVICSERTRKSGYCNKYFECHYPDEHLQKEISLLSEKALKGESVDLSPILNKLPNEPIVCAATVLNAQMKPIDDLRLINTNKLLAEFVVYRSYEGALGTESSVTELERHAVS
jgi:aspartate/glutamate racemase